MKEFLSEKGLNKNDKKADLHVGLPFGGEI